MHRHDFRTAVTEENRAVSNSGNTWGGFELDWERIEPESPWGPTGLKDDIVLKPEDSPQLRGWIDADPHYSREASQDVIDGYSYPREVGRPLRIPEAGSREEWLNRPYNPGRPAWAEGRFAPTNVNPADDIGRLATRQVHLVGRRAEGRHRAGTAPLRVWHRQHQPRHARVGGAHRAAA